MFSLVTACMNRDAHLRQSLPAWLALPGLAEVVIVDWSNSTPLFELTESDPRVRVVRVEGEPRWILSYAYNLGVSQASQDLIFKCDADCVPTPAALSTLPDAGCFYAGYWKSGTAVGKPSVNGQCLFRRAQFERINGYSEFIRTYGRDDEDFYSRLVQAGWARREIPPAAFAFIDHSHGDRVKNQFEAKPPTTAEELLSRNTTFNEMRNHYISLTLPWNAGRPRSHFIPVRTEDPRRLLFRRDVAGEIPIPAQTLDAAALYSLRYLVRKVINLPQAAVEKLDRPGCLQILTRRFTQNAQA